MEQGFTTLKNEIRGLKKENGYKVMKLQKMRHYKKLLMNQRSKKYIVI